MSVCRSQDGALLNATSFAAESVCCWNFSTQIGASVATTAVSARWLAIFSAVLPSVHPSDENPIAANATAPTTAPHTAGFTPGWIFITSPWLWEKGISPVSDQHKKIARGEPAKIDSETTQTMSARVSMLTADDLCLIRPAGRRVGPGRLPARRRPAKKGGRTDVVVATTEERTAPSRVARRTTPAAALASLGIVYGDL